MFGKLVWEKSGDEIKFSPASPDLLIYYIEQLSTENVNQFKFNNSNFDYKIYCKLEQNLSSIANISNRIPFQIDEWDGDLFDQQYLNKLHRQWVKTGIEYPKITLLLRALNGLDQHYRDINNNLHLHENSFRYKFVNYDTDPWQIKNIFGPNILNFNDANISLGFNNLGRSSWEKYKNWDNNINDSDTNDYQMLSGLVYINLNRPATQHPPQEYIDWCKHHNISVIGSKLNLGNIIGLEDNLTDFRKILFRNTHEQDDRFFFEICTK
jgi:hypothetical protein